MSARSLASCRQGSVVLPLTILCVVSHIPVWPRECRHGGRPRSGEKLVAHSSETIFAMALRARVLQVCVISLFTLLPSQAQVNILTNRYDSARTGANMNETVLNTTNVNVNQFGKLYTIPVDGAVYAQPLYVSNVAIPNNRTHNI